MRHSSCLWRLVVCSAALSYPATHTSLVLAEEPRLLRSLSVGGAEKIRCVVFSPVSRTLAAGCDSGVVRLWDPTTGRQTASLEGHNGLVNWVTFSPDGKFFATASTDVTANVWSVPSPSKDDPGR